MRVLYIPISLFFPCLIVIFVSRYLILSLLLLESRVSVGIFVKIKKETKGGETATRAGIVMNDLIDALPHSCLRSPPLRENLFTHSSPRS